MRASGTAAATASTIASAAQQMSMSFGVASASLAAAFFIPEDARHSPAGLIRGIHHAFLALGAFTIVSALMFRTLTSTDGDNVSRHRTTAPTVDAVE